MMRKIGSAKSVRYAESRGVRYPGISKCIEVYGEMSVLSELSVISQVFHCILPSMKTVQQMSRCTNLLKKEVY